MSKSMRRVRILSVAEFCGRFGATEQCVDWLSRVRWPEGFVCPGCGHGRAVFLKLRRLQQCSVCRRQTSLTAGTIFHKSRIPLEKWFWAIYRLAQDKKGCSAMMLSKEIDVCYPTAWLMTHKIRHAMAHDDSRVLLEHLVELDDAFLGGLQPGKRGRGARYKAPLFVAVERLPDGRLGQAAIEPIRQLRQVRLAAFAHQHLSRQAVIRSDASQTFGPLRGMGYRHIPERMRGVFKRAVRSLPAVHLVISNLKRFLLGRHHATAPKHAQRYVGEFVCRFNHRREEETLFQRVLRLATRTSVITYPQLVTAELR